MPLTLTIGAEPEKIQAMTRDFEACFRNQFLGHTLQTLQIRINDFFAFGADEMRMRVRSVAVIAVASLRKPELQHLVEFFKKGHGFVNRGQARGGKTLFHLFIDGFNAWVPVARRYNLEHSHTLRCDSGIMPPESFQHLVETCLLRSHSFWINAAKVMKNNCHQKVIQRWPDVNKKG